MKPSCKKWHCANKVFYFLFPLLIVIFLISCKGHDKSFQSSEDSIDQKEKTNLVPVDSSQTFQLFSGNTIPNEDFVPLFYEGQLAHWIRRMHQDKKGNLWFGTNHYGVIRYRAGTLEYVMENNGINGVRINDIVEDDTGNVWFATDGLGIYKYDGEKLIQFSQKDGLISDNVWSMTLDRNGIFWIGTLDGVSRFNGKEFNTFSIPQPNVQNPKPILSHLRITAILEDKNGNIWFGTDGYGIAIYNGMNFSHLTKKDGLADNNIYDLLEDSKGNLWIGTMYGGISRYDGQSFNNFTHNGTISGIEVGGLFEDKNGNIWFAAENNGVYHYDGKSFTHFDMKDGLDTNGILSIFQDKEDRFWFGGWKGLFRYNGSSFIPVSKNGPWGS